MAMPHDQHADGLQQRRRVRPELHDGEAGRKDQPQQPADDRNEGQQARAQPHQQAVVDAGPAQADGVEDAEHQADRALPADEGGDRIVDADGKAADGGRRDRAAARCRGAPASGASRPAGRTRPPA